MRARFEVDVKSGAASFVPGLLQRQHFSVLDALKGVRALSDDAAGTIDNDRAHTGIGRG